MIDKTKYSGLGTLIENANEKVVDKVVEVDVEKISVNEKNFYNEDYEIESLAEQIKLNGQLEPLLITKDYKLLSGHRRLQAIKLINHDTVICRIMEKPNLSDDDEMLAIVLANGYRTKSSEEVIEEVRILKEIYHRKVEAGEITKSQVSKLISEASGKSQRQVQRIVKQLDSPQKEKTKLSNQEKFDKSVTSLMKMLEKNDVQCSAELYNSIVDHVAEKNQEKFDF